MRIQAKLITLIVSLAVLFFAILSLYQFMKKRAVVEIFKNQLEEKKDNFNSVVNLGGIPLESYINDYTGDEMVRFLEKPDKEWAHTNIYAGLNSLYLNAAWVYSPDRYLVYSVNNLNDEKLQTVPLPKEAFDRIRERKKFCHFFVDTPHGLMEICAATIYPSSDPAKKEQPRGYFVAGKLWDSAYMNFISRLTDTSLEIVLSKENLPKTLNDPEMGVIYFLKPLRTWNHSEIANIKVKVSSPTVRTINRAIRVDFILFLFFITIMLGSSLFYVAYWILSPLFTISLALKESAPIHLMSLITLKNEFGDISRLIDDFFKQKEEIKKAYDELKDTQSQLIQAEKMKVIGTLASGLAHEVRNPLGIIMLGIDLLEQDIGPDKVEWRDTLSKMRDGAERANKIVVGMLNFSRQSTVNPQAVNLINTIEKSLNLVANKMNLANVKIIKELKSANPIVYVDENQIEQVFTNLFLNALDAMPAEGGTLTIRLLNKRFEELQNGVGRKVTELFQPEDAALTCEVEDTGTGIPPAIINKIFDPFFTTKPPGTGVGLGLSVVRKIIDSNKGLINVESQLGKGSRFIITLPLFKEEK